MARLGVSAIINRQAGFAGGGGGSNESQTVERYRKYLPDVVLLDLRMPLMSGVEVAIAIWNEFPDARLIAPHRLAAARTSAALWRRVCKLTYQGCAPQ
jgi:DNA-binding NarL/FixJ family response regulator